MSSSSQNPAPPNQAGQATREGRPGLLLEVNANGQVTIPAHVLDALALEPGDRIVLEETPAGYLFRPWRMDLSGLAPLRHQLRRGKRTFDIQKFRDQPHDPSLRD